MVNMKVILNKIKDREEIRILTTDKTFIYVLGKRPHKIDLDKSEKAFLDKFNRKLRGVKE